MAPGRPRVIMAHLTDNSPRAYGPRAIIGQVCHYDPRAHRSHTLTSYLWRRTKENGKYRVREIS